MKTIKILSLLFLITLFSAKTTVVSGAPFGLIAYVVTIDRYMQSGGGVYIISVVDEKGVPVDRPQLFVDGRYLYVFWEYGPFAEKHRTVKMELNPDSRSIFPFMFNPVTLTGPFHIGSVYWFTPLVPLKMRVINQVSPGRVIIQPGT